MERRANTPKARFWLSFFSFADSSFFPIPPDFLLVALLLSGVKRWAYYAFITTVASIVGGLFGYAIGHLFFDTIGSSIIELYHLHEEVVQVQALYENNAFWAIFVAAFTPIPYKVFTITAGFFHINLLTFIIASIIGRAARFYLVSGIVYKYGEKALEKADRFIALITLAIIVLVTWLLWVNLSG